MVAYNRICILFQRVEPLLSMFRILPADFVLGVNRLGCHRKLRYGLSCFAARCQRITTLPCDLAVGQRGFSCTGERDDRGAAQPDISTSALDYDTKEPTLGSRRVHDEIKAIAVGISSWRLALSGCFPAFCIVSRPTKFTPHFHPHCRGVRRQRNRFGARSSMLVAGRSRQSPVFARYVTTPRHRC